MNPIQGLSSAYPRANQNGPYDPATDTGLVHIGADIPGYGGSWADPHDPSYNQALQEAANARSFGTPSYLGGPGGAIANSMPIIPEAMNALSDTTGQQYKFAKNAFSGLPTDQPPSSTEAPPWGLGGTGPSAAMMNPPGIPPTPNPNRLTEPSAPITGLQAAKPIKKSTIQPLAGR